MITSGACKDKNAKNCALGTSVLEVRKKKNPAKYRKKECAGGRRKPGEWLIELKKVFPDEKSI